MPSNRTKVSVLATTSDIRCVKSYMNLFRANVGRYERGRVDRCLYLLNAAIGVLKILRKIEYGIRD